jgi:hypothetical protein
MVDHTVVHERDAGQREERSGGRNWSGKKSWPRRPVPGSVSARRTSPRAVLRMEGITTHSVSYRLRYLS